MRSCNTLITKELHCKSLHIDQRPPPRIWSSRILIVPAWVYRKETHSNNDCCTLDLFLREDEIERRKILQGKWTRLCKLREFSPPRIWHYCLSSCPAVPATFKIARLQIPCHAIAQIYAKLYLQIHYHATTPETLVNSRPILRLDELARRFLFWI
jgi:hypothetical protein